MKANVQKKILEISIYSLPIAVTLAIAGYMGGMIGYFPNYLVFTMIGAGLFMALIVSPVSFFMWLFSKSDKPAQ